jgi:hypothetical protein
MLTILYPHIVATFQNFPDYFAAAALSHNPLPPKQPRFQLLAAIPIPRNLQPVLASRSMLAFMISPPLENPQHVRLNALPHDANDSGTELPGFDVSRHACRTLPGFDVSR